MSRRLPAEFEPHERTVMCWPTRASLYGDQMERARNAHATVATAISDYEPVTMIAAPGPDATDAAARCGDRVEVIELELDDSWFRDTGPIYAVETHGETAEVVATDWIFNGWGHKFEPHDLDASLARRYAAAAGHRLSSVDMVLEGGSIITDGRGTIVTTTHCLMHPNRNPGLNRELIERHLHESFGTHDVVWLPHGLCDDADTDGHVDNVAAFADPTTILMQGCDDEAEADHDRLNINRRWIDRATAADGTPWEIVEVPVLPFVEVGGRRVPVPYLNLYVGNGFVLVPVSGHGADDEMVALIAERFSGRDTIALDVAAVLAFGGGGIHCITQQIPAIT
jgi:agmatine deiminase